MFESYTGSAGVILDAIRTLFSWLDRAAFGLLEFFYQLFFNVASADLFSNDTIMRFYGRVQLIIGVYMMFLLAMTILKGIMNPDGFTGGKDGSGASKLITRVITALIMLTILVPINIGSPRNEYEEQLRSNGLLFGTLYSLQHRILANNTLGRLILGNDSTSTSYFSSEGEDDLKQSSRIFTSTVLKGFYRINLIDEDDRKHEDGKDDAIFNENRVCKDIDDEVLAAYTKLDANPGDIIGMVNATCEVEDDDMSLLQKALSVFSPKLAGKQRYVFTLMPLVSTITAIIFAVILLSFTIDVAVRAVKLAVLRLIAPIPIISYMDPKGTKDSAFNSWVKTLSSTYLDLFIRLAVVYFVIFLIQDMIVNGVVINHGDGLVGILSLIIIWIGLFAFAKQAPKFIKDVLGMKGETGKLFGGFGEALALGAVGGGIVGGAISRGAAARAGGGNVGKSLLAGFAGGIGGGFNAGKAYMSSKGADSKAVMNANRAYNARNYSNAADESTFGGRMIAGLQGAVGMKNQQQIFDDKIKNYGAAAAAWKRINTALDSDDNSLTYSGPDVKDSKGNVLLASGSTTSTKKANDLLSRMKSSGQYSASEIEAMEEAKKKLQVAKFDAVRQASNPNALFGTEAQIYQAAETIYKIGKKYSGDADHVFINFAGASSVADASISMGADFKGASFNAERQADAIKNSQSYAQAKANAARAEQSAKK